MRLSTFTLWLAAAALAGCSSKPACPSGQTMCDGSCASLASDDLNCGACGKSCPGGQICSSGACQETCTAGYDACTSPDGGAFCARLSQDNDNCGACGTVCQAGQVCAGGTCSETCTTGYTVCSPASESPYCADLQADTQNCGSCGKTCPSGELCSTGSCSATCAAGYTTCGADGGSPYCASVQSDVNNCGDCGKTCPSGELCSNGACSATCAAGYTTCGADGGSPYCASVQSDVNNCGACGKACPSGELCSNGSCSETCSTGHTTCGADGGSPYCASVQSDVNNCGACGKTCPSGELCSNESCSETCAAGYATCGADGGSPYCAYLQTDVNNCGACGEVCPPGEVCSSNECGPAPCDPTGAPFGGGLGTASNPYLICSTAHLNAISGGPAASYYVLAQDLDLTGQAVQIFMVSGMFDGAGHTLQHFSTTSTGSDAGEIYDFGLFGHIGNYPGLFTGSPAPAEIKNLNLEVDSVDAPFSTNVAALVGHIGPGGSIDHDTVQLNGTLRASNALGALVGFTDQDSTISISNSSVSGSGSVVCDGVAPNEGVAGAIGYAAPFTSITNVAVTGITVSCPGGSAAGLGSALAGTANELSVTGVTVSGIESVAGVTSTLSGAVSGVSVSNTSVTSTGNQNVGQNGCGGVVAWMTGTLNAVSVTNTQVNCPAAASVGGVAGIFCCTTEGYISDAAVTGATVAGCNGTAGVAGSLNGGSIFDATVDSTSTIVLTDGGCMGMGGIAGWFGSGNAQQCGSSATLQAETSSTWVGGLVGYTQVEEAPATISDSYADGVVELASGVSSVGGLFGAVFGGSPASTLSITNSYSNIDLADFTAPGIGGVLGSANMASGSSAPGTIAFGQVLAYGTASEGACVIGQSGPANLSVSGTFWDSSQCSGSSDAGTGVGLDSSELTSQAFFEQAGFSFGPGGTWQMADGGYPQLQGETFQGPRSVPDLQFWSEADRGVTLSGSSVAQWNDQSGNGYNVTPPAPSQAPTYVTGGLNGLPVVSFDGNQQWLRFPATPIYDQMTVFAVYQLPMPVGGGWPLTIGGSNAEGCGGTYMLIQLGYGPDTINIAGGCGNDDLATWPGIGQNGTGAAYQVIDWTSTSTHGTQVWDDGNAATMSSMGSDLPWKLPLSYGVPADFQSIGGSYGQNQASVVNFAEILFYSRALAGSERQEVEGYLAWKWGLQASLPASHPYASAAP